MNGYQNRLDSAVDFSKDDLRVSLRATGYDPELSSFFAILGVTYYLALQVFEQTIKDIAMLSQKEGEIVFGYPDETTFLAKEPERAFRLTQMTAKLGEPTKQGLSFGDLERMLLRHHFSVETYLAPREIQKRFL